MGGILFMNENLRIAGNQHYFMGRTKQTEITTAPKGKGEERMRDYTMNGTLIIGCDHGYGNIKTAHFCFKASAEASETAPIFSKDYVKYEDKYDQAHALSVMGKLFGIDSKYTFL